MERGEIDIEDYLLLSETLRKMTTQGFISIFDELKDVEYEDDGYFKLKDALYDVFKHENNPSKKRSYLFIAGKTRDTRVKEDLQLALQVYLSEGEIIDACLSDLKDMGEEILPGNLSSHSITERGEHGNQIRKYLYEKEVTVPY